MRRIAILAAALLATACGGAGDKPTVLVQSGDPDAGAREPSELEVLVTGDADLARDTLAEAVNGSDRDIAALAAVYTMRTGLKRNEDDVRQALRAGVGAEDQMIRALCWRWLATGDFGPAPEWKPEVSADPVAAVFAAAAHLRAGSLPDSLKPYLALPTGSATRGKPPEESALERLNAQGTPFDDRALATAMFFTNAVRKRWRTRDGRGGDGWVAEGARRDLLTLLGMDPEEVLVGTELPGTDAPWPRSKLFAALANPMVAQPYAILRSAVLTGNGPLRIAALRAMAISCEAPVAGDLGAASGAMRDEDAMVRVEAARTFALLTARTTR